MPQRLISDLDRIVADGVSPSCPGHGRRVSWACLAVLSLIASCARPVAPEIVYDEKTVQQLRDDLKELAADDSGEAD